MAENKLKERWKAGKAAVNGWLAIRMGFRLTTIANDSGLMAKAAREAVAGVWQGVGDFR